MESKDLTVEEYREYDVPGRSQPYRIDSPQQLYIGATTHRVVDGSGVVHCVPTAGTVIRWKSKDPTKPVGF